MTSPTATSPRDVLGRSLAAAVERGPAAFADLFAVDGALEYPFAPTGIPRRIQGCEQIRAHLAGRQSATLLRFRGYRSTAIHQTDDPEVIVAELELHGTVVTTSQPVVLPSIAVVRVRDGEILSYRDYFNPLAPAEATGRLPELFAMLTGEQPT
jgi:ketosteroid isomerase-like protein